ncbi:UPF0699 transmembrane protein YdbT [Heyndrickxia sporothermodurans]|nr:UPF0699 transmembrane protein YdbT [Heyndrickxia sporothermodurans]
MSNYKRLHPVTAISNFLKELKQLIAPFIVFFIIGRRDQKENFWDYAPMLIMTIMIIYVLISGIVKWLRFTYRLEEGELRIEHGLFVKKKRYIPFERIQSLNFSEGILHRPFGLVKVSIETAGNSSMEAEAELTAITKMAAEEIQQTIAAAKKSAKKAGEEKDAIEIQDQEKMIYQISNREMFVMASTSGGAGVILSALLAFFSQFNEMIPYEKIFNEVSHIVESGVFLISLIVVIILLAAWICSIIVTMLRFHGFTAKEIEDNLVITRGLLERRQTTIPLHRIQAIRISENPLRQLFGYATVYIESAGGTLTDKESLSVILLPMIKKNKTLEILGDILKGYQFDVAFHQAPIRAKRGYIIREMLKSLPIVIGLLILFWPYGLLGSLLVAISIIYGRSRFRTAGWNLEENQLTLRYRGIVKHTMFMRKNRVQSMVYKESWFQRKLKLASIFSTVKSASTGKTAKVYHLDVKDVETIYQWYKQ